MSTCASAEGEILALVGANGAGKTTLLRDHRRRASSGGRPDHVRRQGRDGAARTSAGQRSASRWCRKDGAYSRGLPSRRICGLPATPVAPGGWNIEALLEVFPMLKARLKTQAGLLSGGEQQATSIGRAMMTNPRLLLLDEISLGLAPLAIDNLYRSLTALFSSGTALVIVEQNLSRVLGVATRICCMLEGRIVLERETPAGDASANYRSLFRPAARRFRGTRGRDLARPNHPRHAARRLLRADRLRAVADVRRHAHHQSGAWRFCHSRCIRWSGCWSSQTGISPFLRARCDHPLMALLGWALQRWVFERSLRAGPLVPLLATFGLAIVIENLLFEAFQRRYPVAGAGYWRSCVR